MKNNNEIIYCVDSHKIHIAYQYSNLGRILIVSAAVTEIMKNNNEMIYCADSHKIHIACKHSNLERILIVSAAVIYCTNPTHSLLPSETLW